MKSNSKRTQRDYSLAFKLSVVDQVEKGEFTYKQAQDHYGIQGCSTVLVWLRKHGRLDWSMGTPIYFTEAPMMTTPKQLTPEQKIKALETRERAPVASLNAAIKVVDGSKELASNTLSDEQMCDDFERYIVETYGR